MKKPPHNSTPEQIAQYRRDWADYYRTRRNPTKNCRKCGHAYPNTNQYFALAPSGWLTSHCHSCAARDKPPGQPGPCPICAQTVLLVRDFLTPLGRLEAPRICRGCAKTVNALRLKYDKETLHRLHEYTSWSVSE